MHREKLHYIVLFTVFALLLTLLAVSSYCKTSLVLSSSAFKNNGMIPKKYTGEGRNISPPLTWSGVPKKVKSFALLCDDPDAPNGIFVHWVIFNISETARSLSAAVPKSSVLPDGSIQGVNSFGNNGYDGPMPPSGTHRYIFKLYVLSEQLKLKSDAKKADLLKAMKGKVLAYTTLTGKYRRER